MKKLGLVLLAFIVAVWFGACGDSKDSQAKSSDNLGESQTINTSDSQSESNESSATSDESQILDSQDLRTDSLKEQRIYPRAYLISRLQSVSKNGDKYIVVTDYKGKQRVVEYNEKTLQK